MFVACVLAVASADYQQPYYGPQHIPVIQNGVPVEPPEVQKARSAHLAAFSGNAPYSAAPAYNQQPAPYNQGYNQGQYNAPSPPGRYTPPAYQTSHVAPKVDGNGMPLDTPEVQAAKANHFAAYSQAHANFGQALSQAQPGGHGQGHYRKRRSIYGGGYVAYPQHVPVIGPNGVPVDTPEVQHAKAAHFAALAEASARAGPAGSYNDGSYDDGSYDGRYDGGAYDGRYDGAYDGGYAGGEGAKWNGPIHIPVLDGNGVPVEPAANQHARAAHLAAVSDAAARAGAGHVGYGQSAPWGGHY